LNAGLKLVNFYKIKMRTKKAQMEKDEKGNSILTEKYVIDLCEENQQYLTPKLNTCLYLHYKGFSKIQALDKYVNVACLWLESNGIHEIENISHMTELRTLYLHQNIISKIEGLSTLTKLVTLNLSHNNIKEIDNLGGCVSLKNLDLSHNMIVDYNDCKGLKACPSLTSVDLSHNHIEYDDKILDFYFQFQNFVCFYFKGNPAIRKIKMYRKKLICGFKKLLYLDDRPVKEIDRIAAVAWMEGGPDLENQKRKEYHDKQQEVYRTYYNRNVELQEEYKKYKAQKIANIKAETKAKKDALLERQSKLRDLIRTARPHTEEKDQLEGELTVVDQELASDMYEILDDDKIVVPPMHIVANQRNQPGYRQRREQQLREEREREARDRERQEYMERERVNQPKASAVIPSPKPESPRVKTRAERMRDEGCVMSTDSESENDPTIMAKRAGYRKEIFKWTEFYEDKLEELLIKHMFDFIRAAQEFSAMVNNFDDENEQNKFYYEITPKILQMKWTDVEIKKYRIHEFTKDKEDLDDEESEDEEVPDVEQFDTEAPVRTYKQSELAKESTKQFNKNGPASSSLVNRLHEFDSSSEDEDNAENYTNLEELD
jgi:hypothetical protein